jgi:hypothetical protein
MLTRVSDDSDDSKDYIGYGRFRVITVDELHAHCTLHVRRFMEAFQVMTQERYSCSH